jgi:hypothetical protein
MKLLKAQQQVAKAHLDTTIFLEGLPGTGKTTAAIERIKSLIRSGVAADSILVLVPQIGLAAPYKAALSRAHLDTSVNVTITTPGSLATQTIDLFWPLIADETGFAHPQQAPHFLSLELVQYYMTRFVEPEIRRKDYFNSVHISPNRLYTQIVDNLNKAALVGFSHEQIAERLKSAQRIDTEQAAIYDDAQACANLFRERCLEYNLLDFSLQMILFANFLWRMEQPRRYLTDQYRHLIVDNLEEDNPVVHDMLADWLDVCDSALLICDSQGGYRRFLGADPVSAAALKARCNIHMTLEKSRVMSADVEAFQVEMARSLHQLPSDAAALDETADPQHAIAYTDNRYLPQMVDWTVENIANLINEDGVPPSEIVILSAFLPDALRFSLQTRLNERGIPNRSYRPSRALRDEPAARTLLTLAKLAHPQWSQPPHNFDLAFALSSAIADLDLVRARLLTDVLFRGGELLPFERIQDAKMQGRITFDLGNRYEALRAWLDQYRQGESLPLDAFFRRIFGEVLSQPKFGFHRSYDAANAAANLIDSARDFRQTVSRIEPNLPIGSEYLKMVDAGVIANQYIPDGRAADQDSVLIAPAYTFLMNNQSVDYQFWLNIGGAGWGQRLYQPLTQPYILSRQWPDGKVWGEEDEFATNQKTLYDLVSGLIRRCRKRIYLGFSQYGEQGFDQRGALLTAVQSMLRRLNKGKYDDEL